MNRMIWYYLFLDHSDPILSIFLEELLMKVLRMLSNLLRIHSVSP